MDEALKTRGTKHLNVETWLLCLPSLSKFLATRVGHDAPKILEYLVILCFERRYP